MELKRLSVAAIAAVFALSGIASLLVQSQPSPVDAVELDGPDPAFRRQDDDQPVLEVVEDEPKGDGDRTAGDDGTSGGDNTGDGDRTAGDDGTSRGDNTGDGDNTRGDDGTSGGNNTGDGDRTAGDDGTSGGNNTSDNTSDNTGDNTGDNTDD